MINPTDQTLLTAFLNRLGLTLETPETRKAYPEASSKGYTVSQVSDGITEVRVGEGDGYYNFYAEFRFDADGKAIGHGIWE